jgi:hypothetical protein
LLLLLLRLNAATCLQLLLFDTHSGLLLPLLLFLRLHAGTWLLLLHSTSSQLLLLLLLFGSCLDQKGVHGAKPTPRPWLWRLQLWLVLLLLWWHRLLLLLLSWLLPARHQLRLLLPPAAWICFLTACSSIRLEARFAACV